MKNNQLKPVEKTYIIQEQPIKQSNLSVTARNKVVNHNKPYQSQNQDSYGPCISFNQNCNCSLEELQRQEQVLKNREIEERINRDRGENVQRQREQENNQGELQQIDNLHLQDVINNAQNNLRVNDLTQLPVMPQGQNLQNLIDFYNNTPHDLQQRIANLNEENQRLTQESTQKTDQIRSLNQQVQNLTSQINSHVSYAPIRQPRQISVVFPNRGGFSRIYSGDYTLPCCVIKAQNITIDGRTRLTSSLTSENSENAPYFDTGISEPYDVPALISLTSNDSYFYWLGGTDGHGHHNFNAVCIHGSYSIIRN